jgi:surfactin synthase thioesterase subunit
MYRCVTAQVQDDEFAFFGHSMGSMIAYELTLALRRNGERLPIHNFFSGRAAPHMPCEQSNLHLLSDDAFKEALLQLGGTPAQFFEYPELMETFYPLLRNDFMLAQTDFSERPIEALDTDITVFFGSDEDFSDEAMMGWRKHTDKCCSLHVLRGDHFFLHHQMPRMLHIIRQTLQQTQMDFEPALTAYPDVSVVR